MEEPRGAEREQVRKRGGRRGVGMYAWKLGRVLRGERIHAYIYLGDKSVISPFF